MIGQIAFTGSPGTANCGGARFSPPADPPFSGEVDDGNGMKLADLGLGCLYSGSASMAGVALPDGFTSILAITGTSGSTLTLGGSDGTGPADCTKGAGPAMHCVNANPGASCTLDADCGGIPSSCALDANCFFGPPTPVSNGALSICIANALRTGACGVADLTAIARSRFSNIQPVYEHCQFLRPHRDTPPVLRRRPPETKPVDSKQNRSVEGAQCKSLGQRPRNQHILRSEL